MGGGAAHPQVLDRRAVLRSARHRAVEQQLVEGQFALEDVAFGQPDFGFGSRGVRTSMCTMRSRKPGE